MIFGCCFLPHKNSKKKHKIKFEKNSFKINPKNSRVILGSGIVSQFFWLLALSVLLLGFKVKAKTSQCLSPTNLIQKV